MADTDKITKLPKWARDHIRTLEADIRRLQDANAHLRGCNAPSDGSPGYILMNGYGDEQIPLGKSFRVVCTSGESKGVEISMDRGYLSARSSNGWMSVIPSVSNVVFLRTVDRA